MPHTDQAMKQYWDKIQRYIKQLMKQKTHHVLLGEIAVATHLSLRQAEEIVTAMIDAGIIRALTQEECNKLINVHCGHAFVLVNPKSIPHGDLT